MNNVDATIALLKNGANKDMQDLKVTKRIQTRFETKECQNANTCKYRLYFAEILEILLLFSN